MKRNGGFFIPKDFKQNISTGQRSMSTQIDLCGRCEPADVKVISARYKKNRLRQVILHGKTLHKRFIDPFVKRNNSCRITGEKFLRKSIYLIKCHIISLIVQS